MPDSRLPVRAHRNDGGRTAALYACDPRTRQREAQPLIAVDGFDATGNLLFDRRTGRLAGAEYRRDAFGMDWIDPRLRTLQQRVDRLLPGLATSFGCNPCGGQRRFIVAAWSDRQPAAYFLFDSQADDARALTLLGGARPGIDALKAAGRAGLEWVVCDEEGHGWRLEANRFDFWRGVEACLARHLKP